MLKLAYTRWRELWQGGLPPRSISALLFALGCVVVATIVRMALGELVAPTTVFASYYAAILIASLVAGARAGAFAAISGALAAFWFFVPPDWRSRQFDAEQLSSLILYLVSSCIIIGAAKSYRDLLWRLRRQQDRWVLLNYELAHRIKNTLAIVQSVASQTLRDHPAARDKLNQRIAALAATNDLLVQSEWSGARFKKILAGELAPYDPRQFDLDGEDFECPSGVATVLALIFHELTTNAAKYGALSLPHGRVDIGWKKQGDRVHFQWRESGGPQPASVRRQGFGTTLLRKGLGQFDGAVEMRFAPNGLDCRLSLSLPRPRSGETIDVSPDRPSFADVPAGRSIAAVGSQSHK
jgi:two-component sensor histidine kinase